MSFLAQFSSGLGGSVCAERVVCRHILILQQVSMAVQRLAQTCAQHRHALSPTSPQVLADLLGWLGYVPVSNIKVLASYSQAVRITVSKESGLPSGSALVPLLLWWLSPPVPVTLVLVCAFFFFNMDEPEFESIIAAAVLYGFMAGTICNFATQLKFYLDCDDALDVCTASIIIVKLTY